MTNKAELPGEIDIKYFKLYIDEQLNDNLAPKLRSFLASLLAIDHFFRLRSKPEATEYLKACCSRIKKYLGYKIIFDESFSAAMTIFMIAISQEDEANYENKNNIKSQASIIEFIVSKYYAELSFQDQQIIRHTVKDLLDERDGSELINLLTTNPKLFHSIVKAAIKNKKGQKIFQEINNNLRLILSKSNALKEKKNTFKGTFAKIFLAGTIIAAASIGSVIAGPALPMLILPASFLAIRYGASLGERTGEKITRELPSIKTETKALARLSKEVSIEHHIPGITIKTQVSPNQFKVIALAAELGHLNISGSKKQEMQHTKNINSRKSSADKIKRSY